MKRMGLVLLISLFAAPAMAFAQAPSPTASPHPSMPWSGITHPNKGNYGNVVRYIEVPTQQVTIPVYVPGPGSLSGDYEQQVVEIPGYIITETTTGYLYPPRVDLQQVTPGAYQWVTLPQQFQPK